MEKGLLASNIRGAEMFLEMISSLEIHVKPENGSGLLGHFDARNSQGFPVNSGMRIPGIVSQGREVI